MNAEQARKIYMEFKYKAIIEGIKTEAENGSSYYQHRGLLNYYFVELLEKDGYKIDTGYIFLLGHFTTISWD